GAEAGPGPEANAGPRVKHRHGGAPRGARPASWQIRNPWRSTPLHGSYHKPLMLQNATLWRCIRLYATLLRRCGHSPDTQPYAETARPQARNRHRPPPPRRAQKTLLDAVEPRHSARLPAQ